MYKTETRQILDALLSELGLRAMKGRFGGIVFEKSFQLTRTTDTLLLSKKLDLLLKHLDLEIINTPEQKSEMRVQNRMPIIALNDGWIASSSVPDLTIDLSQPKKKRKYTKSAKWRKARKLKNL